MRAWRSQALPFGIAASSYSIGTAVGIVNDLAGAVAAVAGGRGHSLGGLAHCARVVQSGRHHRRSSTVAQARFGRASAPEVAAAHGWQHSMAAS